MNAAQIFRTTSQSVLNKVWNNNNRWGRESLLEYKRKDMKPNQSQVRFFSWTDTGKPTKSFFCPKPADIPMAKSRLQRQRASQGQHRHVNQVPRVSFAVLLSYIFLQPRRRPQQRQLMEKVRPSAPAQMETKQEWERESEGHTRAQREKQQERKGRQDAA